eukprot:483142_1
MASQMKQIKAIKRAIRTKNTAELKKLAVKHGFLSDKLRKQVWPLVLGMESSSKSNANTYATTPSKLESSSVDPIEYHQIEQDLKRTPFDYYNIKSKSDEDKCRASLGKILHNIFDSNDQMHYLQGFNDVTSVLYAVCNNTKLTHQLTTKVAQTLMSDFIRAEDINFSSCKFIFDIIDSNDKNLSQILENEHHDFIAISISWLITWFAHQITDINVISRIYDYCLCSAPHQMVSSYLCAALMLYLKHDILMAKKNEMTLFEFFQELQWDKLNFNVIIYISEFLINQNAKAMDESYSYLSDSLSSLDSPSASATSPRAPSAFDLNE